jgi:hypothetical protein
MAKRTSSPGTPAAISGSTRTLRRASARARRSDTAGSRRDAPGHPPTRDHVVLRSSRVRLVLMDPGGRGTIAVFGHPLRGVTGSRESWADWHSQGHCELVSTEVPVNCVRGSDRAEPLTSCVMSSSVTPASRGGPGPDREGFLRLVEGLSSAQDDPDTVQLPHPIGNDTVAESGRPWAWTMGQRYVSLDRTGSDRLDRPGRS